MKQNQTKLNSKTLRHAANRAKAFRAQKEAKRITRFELLDTFLGQRVDGGVRS